MRYKILIIVLLFNFLVTGAQATEISGEAIIRKVDANMTFDSGRFESEMVIHIRDQVRTKKMVSYAEGREKSFAEFIYPARDKGVKFLKIEDNMWIYMPSVEKIIKIAGHMLRQSMMGSDFSYEDSLESSKLVEKYNAKLITEETIAVTFRKGTEEVEEKRQCYVVNLLAKVKEVTYYRRKIWVDKEVFLPLREELFAKSGKKLKVMELGNIESYEKRYYPMYYSMRNLLRKDSLTEMIITKAEFDIQIPEETFTQRNLLRR